MAACLSVIGRLRDLRALDTRESHPLIFLGTMRYFIGPAPGMQLSNLMSFKMQKQAHLFTQACTF